MPKAITSGYITNFIAYVMEQMTFVPNQVLQSAKKPESDRQKKPLNLAEAEMNIEYIIKEVISENKEIVNFLFSLGCFKGQSITVISCLSNTFVVVIKDARYSIDLDLAQAVKLF